MKERKRYIPSKLRKKILKKYKNKCAKKKCQRPATHIHHIIPYCDCLSHEEKNLILLCEECHSEFHNSPTSSFELWLGLPPIYIMRVLYSFMEKGRYKEDYYQKAMTINKIMDQIDKLNKAYIIAKHNNKKMQKLFAIYTGDEHTQFYTEKIKKWKPIYELTDKDYDKGSVFFLRNEITGKHSIVSL